MHDNDEDLWAAQFNTMPLVSFFCRDSFVFPINCLATKSCSYCVSSGEKSSLPLYCDFRWENWFLPILAWLFCCRRTRRGALGSTDSINFPQYQNIVRYWTNHCIISSALYKILCVIDKLCAIGWKIWQFSIFSYSQYCQCATDWQIMSGYTSLFDALAYHRNDVTE